MSRKTILICAVVLVLVAGAGFGWTRLNRAAVGIPNFYVWKFLSGQSHNGHRAPVNGISIYYETYGHGQPVLLLHGATAFLETMHYFSSVLRAGMSQKTSCAMPALRRSAGSSKLFCRYSRWDAWT